MMPQYDRRAAALKFLRNISLFKSPGAEKEMKLKRLMETAGDAARKDAGASRVVHVQAPKTRQEKQGWEEKLADDEVVGSQVWFGYPSQVPFMVFSVLHTTTSDENKRRRNRENLLLLNGPGAALKSQRRGRKTAGKRTKRRGVSYAVLLDEPAERYDPAFLCGGFKLKRHRAVMKLPGVVASVISYVREKERKKELNSLFKARHAEWLTSAKFSLSKAKKIKSLLLDIALALDLEIATAALAYAYFERLVMENVVSKYNRKVAAGAALLLAFKYNEPVTPDAPGDDQRLPQLFEAIENTMHVKRQEVIRTELGALVNLKFDLQIEPETIFLIFEGMLAAAPYDDLKLPPEYAALLRQQRPQSFAGHVQSSGRKSSGDQYRQRSLAVGRTLTLRERTGDKKDPKVQPGRRLKKTHAPSSLMGLGSSVFGDAYGPGVVSLNMHSLDI